MTPAPLQLGQAPSELALNSAGFTPLAFANALRIGSSSPVYVAGLLRREPLIAAWSTDTTPSRPDTEPSISELFPDPATPVTTTSTPSGMSTSTSCRLWVLAPRTSSTPDGVRTDCFKEARSSRCRPVSVPLARSPSTVPSNTTSPPAVPAPGPRSTTWSAIAIVSGLCSTTSTVLPLSRSCSSRSFIRCDVVRVQPDRRLVEHVGDVGERRPELADHLGALRLAARQRARRPVEREVAQPDLHERVEGLPQRREQRRHRRLVETAHPLGQVADLHRAGVGDVDPLDLRRPGGLVEPGAAAVGTGGERHRPLHERADVRLHRVDVLGQHRLLDLRDQTLVRQVDAVDLDLGRLLVEQVVELLLGELADRLVRVEVAAAAEDAAVPAVHAVAGDRERTLVERLAVVVQLRTGRSRSPIPCPRSAGTCRRSA